MLWQINSQVGHQNAFEPTDRHQIGYSGCYFETISAKNCSSQENILMKFSHATPLRQFKTKKLPEKLAVRSCYFGCDILLNFYRACGEESEQHLRAHLKLILSI